MTQLDFFNTTREEGDLLEQYKNKAVDQQDAVLQIFKNHGGLLSPSKVQQWLMGSGLTWPLTSIRRAITNLTDAGKLEKTSHKTIGIYDRPEYLWTLKKGDEREA